MKPPSPILSLLAWLCLSLAPCTAVTGDGFMWHNTRVGQTDYLPLDDLRSFYKFIPVEGGAGTRTVGNGEINLTFGPDSRDLLLNGIRCRLSHPTRPGGQGDLLVSKVDMVKLIDPVLRPTYIPNRRAVRTVVVDAGHGGHDAGTVGAQVREADTTLLVAASLGRELEKRGFQVQFTHSDNRYLSDQQRVDAANAAQDAIFISLHLNSGRSDIQGVETYTVEPAEPGAQPLPGNRNDAANAALAIALQSSLVRRCGAVDGGFRRAHFSILSSVECPAALVELGYATHGAEGALLATQDYQASLAKALAEGVATFAKMMDPETTLHERETAAAAPAPPAAVKPAAPAPVKQDKPTKQAKGAANTTTSSSRNKASTRKSTANPPRRRAAGTR